MKREKERERESEKKYRSTFFSNNENNLCMLQGKHTHTHMNY
jgi:hypothetical protein